MKQTFFYLTIAAMCSFGLSAQAQDTSSTETQASEATATQAQTTETADTQTAEQEYPVADENQEPLPGQVYLRETHGAWEVRCIKAAEDAEEGSKELCRLYQLLNDEQGIDVAEVNIQRLPEGGAAAAGVDFASPLGSLLSADVLMRIDSAKAKRYRYSRCDQYGCFARFGLTGKELTNLKKGSNAHLTIVAYSAPKTPIKLTMSLKGFTAAWNSVAP